MPLALTSTTLVWMVEDGEVSGDGSRLFSEFERADPAPKRNSEASFLFLDRVRGSYWDAVRKGLDDWFTDYRSDTPIEKARDLRARYRSPDERQHHPAWWELYLHRLLRGLHREAEVGVEEDRGEGVSRPDFFVARSGERFYVEAARSFAWVAEDPGRHAAREAAVLDAITELTSDDFRVGVEFIRVGPNQPRRVTVQRELASWLASLNADDALAAYQAKGVFGLPTTNLTPGDGWNVLVHARPLGPSRRVRGHPLVEIGPSTGGWVIEETAIRDRLDAKAGAYGRLGCPFVVALMPESQTFADATAANILHGREERLFDPMHPEGGEIARDDQGLFSDRRHDGVSGVLFGAGIYPWTVATTWPRLWENPFAAYPLFDWALPGVPRVSLAEHDELESGNPEGTPSSALGIDVDWPPGSPFET